MRSCPGTGAGDRGGSTGTGVRDRGGRTGTGSSDRGGWTTGSTSSERGGGGRGAGWRDGGGGGGGGPEIGGEPDVDLWNGMSLEEALAVDQGIAVRGYWGAVRFSQNLN